MKCKRLFPAVAALVVVAGLLAMTSSVQGHGTGSGLFGRPFLSSHTVAKNGERVSLVEGTRIRLKFERREANDAVRWRSGCNHFGAPVEITPTHLDLGLVVGTDMGCSHPLHRQDRWVTRFFASDPAWTRKGRKLRLTRGDDVIRLRRPAP